MPTEKNHRFVPCTALPGQGTGSFVLGVFDLISNGCVFACHTPAEVARVLTRLRSQHIKDDQLIWVHSGTWTPDCERLHNNPPKHVCPPLDGKEQTD